MKLKHLLLASSMLFFSIKSVGMNKDDPVVSFFLIDHLEYKKQDELTTWGLESDIWIGKDINKFWIKTELEYADGEFEEAEVQALYSRAIKPYWDAQFGIRHDFEQAESRNWAVIGLNGLSPYYFEVDTALFIGEQGRVAARFSAEYELMLTQKWVLSPEFEMNVYTQNDEINAIGSGLSDASFGIRLRYEFVREFGVYLGFEHEKKFGNTAKFHKQLGEAKESNQWLVGIRVWF